MGIPLRLLSPVHENLLAKNRFFVELWVKELIDADAAAGRRQTDFTTKGMSDTVDAARPLMKQNGFDTYQGAGNVFYVAYKQGQPLVIHARPLAQRIVRPKFT